MNSYYCKDMYKFYKLNGGKLDYHKFKAIIAEHNKLISDLIMEVGYQFNIPHHLGFIEIFKNKRHIKINESGNIVGAVNWGESNKLKQGLIDQGKNPYEAYRDELGTITGDNGGEKWLVYHVDELYYSWGYVPSVFLHNGMYYRFKPTWTNSRTLISRITPDSEFIYKDTKGNNAANRSDFIQRLISKNRKDVQSEQQQLAG